MIKFYCASCQRKLGVPEDYAGRRVRCTHCDQATVVPLSSPADVPPEAVASATSTATAATSNIFNDVSNGIELQPRIPFGSEIEAEEDPNAELLREFRRQQPTFKTNKSSLRDLSPTFERFGALSGVLNPIVRRIGSFPLAVAASVLLTALVITVWNVVAVAVGTPLEMFYVVAALAAGMGLCLVSEQRGKVMGFLALFLAFLAIISARIVQTHLFVLSEWKKVVVAVDVPPDRERLYLMLLNPMGRHYRTQARQEAAEENSGLVATAIAAQILDRRIEPMTGQELYLATHWQVDQKDHPLDPDAEDIVFEEPALAEAWTLVAEQLRQWEDKDARADAASRYYYRRLFLMEQCRYKTILDDYTVAMAMGFFMSGGCIFFALRLFYCLIGLIGAYKTCSESYMD